MTGIRIVGLEKRFGDVVALADINLVIGEGEFFTLLGPSGCGKTTLLRTIAGFHRQDRGEVWLGDERVDSLPAHRRDTGMVFQNYAVFPPTSPSSRTSPTAFARASYPNPRSRGGSWHPCGPSTSRATSGARPTSSPAASSSGSAWRGQW